MPKKYSISDYDKYVCLKPGFKIWLVIVYFLHPYILFLSTIQMGRGQKNASVSWLKDTLYPDDFGFFLACIVALPVISLIIAYIKRKPGASAFIKKLWRNGLKILISVAVLNIVILFVPTKSGATYHITTIYMVQLVIAVIIIIFLYSSKRVKDTFADFPE